jgi:hypothetical protein
VTELMDHDLSVRIGRAMQFPPLSQLEGADRWGIYDLLRRRPWQSLEEMPEAFARMVLRAETAAGVR